MRIVSAWFSKVHWAGSRGCGNSAVRSGFDQSSSSHPAWAAWSAPHIDHCIGSKLPLNYLHFSFVVGDERHFLVLFGYKTALPPQLRPSEPRTGWFNQGVKCHFPVPLSSLSPSTLAMFHLSAQCPSHLVPGVSPSSPLLVVWTHMVSWCLLHFK